MIGGVSFCSITNITTKLFATYPALFNFHSPYFIFILNIKWIGLLIHNHIATEHVQILEN